METTNVNIKNWKSLIKPAKLDIQLSDDKSFAKIIAEPSANAQIEKESVWNAVSILKIGAVIKKR